MKIVSLFLSPVSKIPFEQQILPLLIGACGGLLLSCLPVPVGWMIGAILFTGIFSLWRPEWAQSIVPETGVHPIWRQLGQFILAIQLGHHISPGVMHILRIAGFSISLVLLLSILLATLSGLLLWRFSQSDLLTSLYATTPGGISAMPAISAEVGANSVVVTFVQMVRNVEVVSFIPFITMFWQTANVSADTEKLPIILTAFHNHHLVSPVWLCYVWTAILIFAAYSGYLFWRKLALPAAPLVGGMIGASLMQFVGEYVLGSALTPWWSPALMVIAQVFLGVSIGSKLNRSMFVGMNRTLIVGTITSTIYIGIMVLCSIATARLMGISLITAVLAFAPGGVAEMALTASLVGANAAFVLAVQTIRLFLVLIALPPFFRIIQIRSKPRESSRIG